MTRKRSNDGTVKGVTKARGKRTAKSPTQASVIVLSSDSDTETTAPKAPASTSARNSPRKRNKSGQKPKGKGKPKSSGTRRSKKTKGSSTASASASSIQPPVSLNQQQSITMETMANVRPSRTTTTTTSTGNEDDNHCVICMDEIDRRNKKILPICRHCFCTPCIDEWFRKTNPICPSCGMVYGAITGNQPESGQMTDMIVNMSLPGYESYNCIQISYSFPNGYQTEKHPNPGQPYSGTSRAAYLPNNAEGQKTLRLLRTAFDRRLIFTVGRSVTTGCDNTVVWNDIHHKTNVRGGSTGFGYPDPTYMNRVQQELASKGVVE